MGLILTGVVEGPPAETETRPFTLLASMLGGATLIFRSSIIRAPLVSLFLWLDVASPKESLPLLGNLGESLTSRRLAPSHV